MWSWWNERKLDKKKRSEIRKTNDALDEQKKGKTTSQRHGDIAPKRRRPITSDRRPSADAFFFHSPKKKQRRLF